MRRSPYFSECATALRSATAGGRLRFGGVVADRRDRVGRSSSRDTRAVERPGHGIRSSRRRSFLVLVPVVHTNGAAAYAIKAARAAAPIGEGEAAGRLECHWQRDQLPTRIGELVLDDQRLRNDICWSVFDC
jgi:hypothetical protein